LRGQRVAVDVEHGDDLAAAQDRHDDLAPAAGIACDVTREPRDIGDDHRAAFGG
jgi:hypothetical protein